MVKIVSYTVIFISLGLFAWEGITSFAHSPEQLPTETAELIKQQTGDSPAAKPHKDTAGIETQYSQDSKQENITSTTSSTPVKSNANIAGSSPNTTANTNPPITVPTKAVQNPFGSDTFTATNSTEILAEPLPNNDVNQLLAHIPKDDLHRNEQIAETPPVITQAKSTAIGYPDTPYIPPDQRTDGNLGGPPTPEMVFASPDGNL